ncbi:MULTISPECIES: phenylacetate--CoA ligase family protein [unclassified Clostridium]|uniref:phenylacetate--CoA ligase family protein n=1 Tax=unclassified Clostridium TaxID=2614128 RepID=UPI00029752A6|nr:MULTISPECIES: phenylacetate--CoA ligase family protein [unclassified Clostridium]EKQ56949.1 MAG: coenzyme F390 synthetase [Clostridium sp. Maddingley MBC34-26]
MNSKILKKLNGNMPDFIKLLAKNIIRKKLIENRVFLEQYEELMKFEKLSDYEKKEIQFHKLKKSLCYAYENTKYYKNTFDTIGFNPYEMKDISEMKLLPQIDKKEIFDRYDEFISSEKMDFYCSSTGGSTGKEMIIPLDKDSIYREKAFIYHCWSKLGYDYKKSRLATFRGMDFAGKIQKYNPLYNEVILSPVRINNYEIREYVKIIEKFRPNFIHGYPSAIYSFCKVLKENNIILSTNIKGVFFISETVDEIKRTFIEQYFNCKSLAFYGHTERAVFAEEGFDKCYKFNELYGFTEIDTDDSGSSRIICTGFLNKKMPLIRFITDDVVKEECEGFKIYGHRQKEVLIGKHGEEVSITSLEINDKVLTQIRFYQYVQKERGKFIFNIVPEKHISDEDIKLIKKLLDKKLINTFEYTIEVVDRVILSSRGKFSTIVQCIK